MELNPKAKKKEKEKENTDKQLNEFVNAANTKQSNSDPYSEHDNKKKKAVNVLLTERDLALIDDARAVEEERTGVMPSRVAFMKSAILLKAKQTLDM